MSRFFNHIDHKDDQKWEFLFAQIDFLILIQKNIMPILDDIQADVAALATALTSLATAVSGISSSLPAGAISASDAQALKASLDAEVTQAQNVLAQLSTPTPAPVVGS